MRVPAWCIMHITTDHCDCLLLLIAFSFVLTFRCILTTPDYVVHVHSYDWLVLQALKHIILNDVAKTYVIHTVQDMCL